ncbi:MAG: GNAT family N-acetyltransferase [Nocardioidaceae bacterium]
MPPNVVLRAVGPEDQCLVTRLLVEEWGSVGIARRNELVDASLLPGFLASIDGEAAGLATVDRRDGEYEIVSIAASVPRRGVGRAMLKACFADAEASGCRRVWLVTTNDNVTAFAFYQKLGMDLCAVHRGAVRRARELKPSIPLRAANGIPIDHEIEFERILRP